MYSKVRLHWGFTVRQIGASAAQLAYILPPPPTVIGSFMNPLARILGLGESIDPKFGPASNKVMDCAARATLSAAAGLDPDSDVGIAVYAEPSRITASIYKTETDYEEALKMPPYQASEDLLPVQAVGAASSPKGLLVLAWLLDPSKLSDCLKVNVEVRDLKAAAWSLFRVGSREGLVSLVNADVIEGSEIESIQEDSLFKSILYQPEECVNPLTALPKITLYDLFYKERSYLVSSHGGGPSSLIPPYEPVGFKLKSGCKAARSRRNPELALSYPISSEVM